MGRAGVSPRPRPSKGAAVPEPRVLYALPSVWMARPGRGWSGLRREGVPVTLTHSDPSLSPALRS